MALLSLLLPLLIGLAVALLLTVARGVLHPSAAQRIEIVGQLPRAIEILFRTRTIRTARTLLRGLKLFGKIVETALDRALIGDLPCCCPALLTLLLAFSDCLPSRIRSATRSRAERIRRFL